MAADGVHWLIEVKSDRDAGNEDVRAKRAAAQRWANHVTAAPKLNGIRWHYLLVREADLTDARGVGRRSKGSARPEPNGSGSAVG